MKLARDHLAVLLNAYYDDDHRSIPVAHPSDEVSELLRVELGQHDDTVVRFTTGPLSYETAKADVERAHGERVASDLPGEEHYARALAGAGLLDPENRREIEEVLDRHGFRDLAAGHHPVFVGIDTNLLMWYPETLLRIDPACTDDSDRPAVNGFALASGVKEELDFHYRNPESSQLSDAFGSEYDRLAGQPVSDNRQGLLGLYEYRRLLAERRVDHITTPRGDDGIVDGYAAYDANSRKDLLLFSNDHGFVDRATDAGVTATHVSFAIDAPRKTTATWSTVADALYLLVVCFGVLELPKVTLYGVWPGKDGHDWEHERILVDSRSPVYERRLDRATAIVDAFESHS